jgi:hypothetical protein
MRTKILHYANEDIKEPTSSNQIRGYVLWGPLEEPQFEVQKVCLCGTSLARKQSTANTLLSLNFYVQEEELPKKGSR